MPELRIETLNNWLSDHNGVVHRSALVGMGFGDPAISRLIERGHLRRLMRGVYIAADRRVEALETVTAACLANTAVAIGFTTAGVHWGWRGMRDPRIHALVPHGSSPTLPGVVVHRCRRIDPVDLTGRRRDGVRFTSPPRTLFDVASILEEDPAASAVEQALAERRCTIATLMSTLARLRAPNRPGAARFERVLRSRSALRGLARSELERQVRAAVLAAGLPTPILNLPFILGTGDRIVIDVAWPQFAVAVEVDHPFWHDRETEAARDKRRDRKLAAMGWVTLRISQHDVETALAEAVADVAVVLGRRGWSGGPVRTLGSGAAPLDS